MNNAETSNHVLYGPLVEETMLSSGLDYYKLTMSQFEYEKEPDAEVTFRLNNRGQHKLSEYLQPEDLQQRLDFIRERGWTDEELDYFRSMRTKDGEQLFGDDFVDFLKTNELPPVRVRYDVETEDLAVETSGKWPLVTFWETIVMSETSQAYFENLARRSGQDVLQLYEHGDKNLDEDIDILHGHPLMKVIEFGTRRRYSLRWQKHVTERLKDESSTNLVGTSNIALACTENLAPIGTYAHELPMVYAGLADARGQSIRHSHERLLDDWHSRYGQDLGIALSDTFGSDAFFADFTTEQAQNFHGTRQDSGDPVDYAKKVIRFYDDKNIDPTTKTIIFSNALSMREAGNLHDQFQGHIDQAYGIGTHLSNNLGEAALNIVMKAVQVYDPASDRKACLVKLSDDPGKHTGPPLYIEDYKSQFGYDIL